MMTKRNLSKQRIEKFFKKHAGAAASIVCANLDQAELRWVVDVIENEGILPGDLHGYQVVVDSIVRNRKLDNAAVEAILEVSEITEVAEGNCKSETENLFPPVGNVRQIDPKVPGIPWLEGNQLKIRIADTKALVERFNVEQRDMGGDATKNSQLLPLKLGKPRILKRSTKAQLDALKLLKRDFPHFTHAVDHLHSALHARYLCASPATFRPILFVGAAGVGKTEFLNRVGLISGLKFCELNSSTSNDSIGISGLSPPWKNARCGLIANIFKIGDSDEDEGDGNPIILIDELDKASTMGQSSEVSSSAGIFEQLLGVLETGSGGTFTDSYLGSDLKLHCNYVNWVFGANEISRIPTYFLSRLTVIPIQHPSKKDLREGLVDSVYRGVLEKVPYAPFFVKQLSQEVVDLLSETGMTPREIRRLIESLLEKCMSKFSAPPELESVWITPDDLSINLQEKRSNPMGFITEEAYVR